MKRILIISAILTFPILFGDFTYKKSAGSHPGSTGAPEDNTCAKSGCHNGTVILNDTTVNKLIFSQPDSTYVPGQTYTITIKTSNPGIQRFGYEFQALIDGVNTEAGTIVVTDAVRTHTLTHTVPSGPRNSMTHSTIGTTELSPGYNEWTFDWIAPATNVGDIIFYYATNSTNNNNASSGDQVFNNTFRVQPFGANSLNELIDEQSVNAAFNNETNQIVVNYFLKSSKKVTIKLLDGSGREILKSESGFNSKGQHKEELSLKNNLSQGIYYLNLFVGTKSISKKIIIK